MARSPGNPLYTHSYFVPLLEPLRARKCGRQVSVERQDTVFLRWCLHDTSGSQCDLTSRLCEARPGRLRRLWGSDALISPRGLITVRDPRSASQLA